MEIKYPILLGILAVLVVAAMIFGGRKKKKEEFKQGSKIANTEYLEKTSYYKRKVRWQKVLVALFVGNFLVATVAAMILTARLVEVKVNNKEEYNRDIFLCMDVSWSVAELDVELVDNLADVVEALQGERFGISIFNSSSVVLSPLTDDYEYVLDILSQVQESIEAYEESSMVSNYDDDWLYLREYVVSGTTEESEARGGSLIGDGLASCVYSFSNLDEERTRVIILSTDNDLAGEPLVTLDEAATIASEKGILVFGIVTENAESSDEEAFQEAVEKTGGKLYKQEAGQMKEIVADIEETSKTVLKNQVEVSEQDEPLVPLIILVIAFAAMIVLGGRILR